MTIRKKHTDPEELLTPRKAEPASGQEH